MAHLSSEQFNKIQKLARLQVKETDKQRFIDILEK